MNDPFDSRGVCWNTDEIEDFLKTRVPKDKIKEFGSIDGIVEGAIASLRNNIKITCFSEELFSMPMWSHYANNHKGFCIEYDFTRLSYEKKGYGWCCAPPNLKNVITDNEMKHKKKD
jgi:hypothetical protein